MSRDRDCTRNCIGPDCEGCTRKIMSKTTQVKVIIEAFPHGENATELVFKYYPNGDYKLIWEVSDIINSKCFWHDQKDIETDEIQNSIRLLKDGESRESIIKSLWEYQKSLLPEGYGMLETVIGAIIITNPDNIPDEPIYFYAPALRIVTITRWEKED